MITTTSHRDMPICRKNNGQDNKQSSCSLFLYNTTDTEMSAILDPIFPHCPVRNILSRIADKWSLLVMHELEQHKGPMRFSELQKRIPDISQKMLSATLKNLMNDGLLTKTIYPEVPPRTEYSMTERAKSFMLACQPMLQWAIDNFADIIKDRQSHKA